MSMKTMVLALAIFSFNSVSALWRADPYRDFRGAHEKALRQGVRDGHFSYRHCDIHLRDGRLDGLSECRDNRGNTTISSNYVDGRLDGTTTNYYTRSMQPEFVANYQDNRLEGIQRSFYRNGNEKEVYSVSNNLKDGLYQSFHRSGELSRECTYERGALHGYCETYPFRDAVGYARDYQYGVNQYSDQELALMSIRAQEDQARAARLQARATRRQTRFLARNLRNNGCNIRRGFPRRRVRARLRRRDRCDRRRFGNNCIAGNYNFRFGF